MAKSNERQWLAEAREDMNYLTRRNRLTHCIFSAPKELLKEYEDAYVPQIVSIGPYHFGKEGLREMERIKGEAAYRQLVRIRSKPGKGDFDFNQVIEKIKSMEEKIKGCYDKGTPFKGEVLGWMMARDACFILEFFRNYICESQEPSDDHDYFGPKDFRFLPQRHPIFGPKSETPGMKSEIMKDLIKLENQIPLFVLKDVLAMEMGSSEDPTGQLHKLLRSVFRNVCYRPFQYCADGESPSKNHILDIYHYSCLGDGASKNEKKDHVILNVSCCSCSAYGVECSCLGRVVQHSENQELESSNSAAAVEGGSHTNVKHSKQLEEWWRKVPSAVQLKNGGVKFQADGKNVNDVRYERKSLTLVEIKLDEDSEIFIRNLIALEICSPHYKHQTMTAYAKFLHELCQTETGVDVMREKGVIIGNLWHQKRETRLLNVSNLTTSQPACQSIRETRENLSNCIETQRSISYRTLWNEFLKAYGSKPWLVMGGVGATIGLLLAVVQAVFTVYPIFLHQNKL